MNWTQERSKWGMILAVLLALMPGALCGLGGQSAWAAGELQAAWMKGSSVINEAGTYGEFQTPDPANKPGARLEAVSWTDSSGGFWLFGGSGYAAAGQGYLNDLWQYDRSSGNWAWMKGSNGIGQGGTYGFMGTPDKDNTPGARGRAVSWVDGSGMLWLFGGGGYDGSATLGNLNDLWKFDTEAGVWTWMNGSTTVNQSGVYPIGKSSKAAVGPGARFNAASWVDPVGYLYLFGGYGFDGAGNIGLLNDLWRCSADTGLWTWVGGSTTVNPTGHYGALGEYASENIPGGRQGAVCWVDDAARIVWLFGGYGYGGTGSQDHLNDLWKYNLATAQWAWVKGSSSGAAHGTYGTLGTPAPANTPGARTDAVSFKDLSGNLWLFGGAGWDGSGGWGYLNDLWKFDRTSGNWTWMKGASTQGAVGTYGTPGVRSSANMPGSRQMAVSWSDETGGLWLMGGDGNGSTATSGGKLNDLWCWPDTVAPTGTVLVNNNRAVTNNVNVTLSLTWADMGGSVARMKFSNDAVGWTAWEALAATRDWKLQEGEGYHTVRAMFRDASGNNSIVYNDYIRLDTILPTGSIIINKGDLSTKNRVVSLGLTWSDGTGSGVTRMRFSIDGAHWTAWEYPVTPKSYTLPATPQHYTVRVQYLDAGNNYSLVYSDYIKLLAP